MVISIKIAFERSGFFDVSYGSIKWRREKFWQLTAECSLNNALLLKHTILILIYSLKRILNFIKHKYLMFYCIFPFTVTVTSKPKDKTGVNFSDDEFRKSNINHFTFEINKQRIY